MKKLFIALTVFVASLALPAAALADSTMAFSPLLTGTVAISPVGNSQQNQKWTLMASGTEAPLGDFNYQSDLVVHMQNGVPATAEGQGVFTGTGSSTGDSISFNLKLTFGMPTTSDPNTYPFTGTFSLSGGTGRFQGAHGGGAINPGGANPTAGTFFGAWDGSFAAKKAL